MKEGCMHSIPIICLIESPGIKHTEAVAQRANREQESAV